MPHLENGQTIFPLTPEDMANGHKLVEAGATYIGGCCGTTPAHIKAIKEALADVSEPIRKTPNPNLALASRSKTVFYWQRFTYKINRRTYQSYWS